MDRRTDEHEERPLNADPSAQLTLLDLQAHDSRLAQLNHRRASLPEIARIADVQSTLTELEGRRIEVETLVDDLSRAQRKADAEVETVKARRVRDEERLNSGAITNPKDLSGLQHELVALDRRIGSLEDEELEVMEQLEEAQTMLASVLADIEAVRDSLGQLTATRDAALVEIDAAVQEASAERVGIASVIPADLIALYDKVRAQYSGLGAAALRARKCEGCRLELNSADIREIAAAPVDQVLRCPECSRILVRTPESGL